MTPLKKFITIEGIDGCGKTTQARLLASWLSNQFTYMNIVHTYEPGGAGKEIRGLVLGSDFCPKSELLLFLADRLEHVRKIILPSLENSKWVICERYTDSTLAYQSFGRGIPRADVENFFAWCDFPKPALTIFLDISVDDAVSRMKMRGGEKDNFESAGLDFISKLKNGYDEIAKFSQKENRIVRIDAARSVEKVASDIIAAVEKKFEL